MSSSDKKTLPSSLTDSRLAALTSERIRQAFLEYRCRFLEISQGARERFLTCDWKGSFADSSERLHLYNRVLDSLVSEIEALMANRFRERKVWMAAKAVYSAAISHDTQWEIAESFFNSVTRRVFATVGVDQDMEFVNTDFEAPPTGLSGRLLSHRHGASLTDLLRAALTDSAVGGFPAERWENLETQLSQVGERILATLAETPEEFHLEMISTVFFRARGAYLLGRLLPPQGDGLGLPLAFCLRHSSERGLRLDAVLLDERDLSILFSYTRAYFRAVVDCPYDLVWHLRALMPHKPLGDLYNAIGYHRHGKTELYRDFVAHMRRTDHHFVAADGTRGMVMLVFTLPSYDVVFKLIKDRFDFPKNSSAEEVKRSYRMVFEHDRAGRLVEAHEFEHLRIPQNRFDPALLEELLNQAGATVRLEGRQVLLSHAYVERRVRPLNLYLREADDERVVAAALDYGQAIKDLAASNIFAGDLFTKNFGVTRTGRVVFYDYDELCFLTDCNFRDLPQPTTIEQEMAAEPWYSVRDNDIFPEEFSRFLRLPESARDAFQEAHGDLFQPDFWRGVQAQLQDGKMIELYPYKAACRLPRVRTP